VTTGRGGKLSEAEEFGTLADVTASPAELGLVFQNDFVFTVEPGKKLVNEIEANEGGAIDTNEEFGVKRVLKVVEGTAKRVSLRAAVEEDVVAVGFDQGDVVDQDEARAVVVFNQDAMRIAALLLDGLENFGKARGERAGGTRMIFTDAAENLLEAIFGERF
jgi:hypothetical protein